MRKKLSAFTGICLDLKPVFFAVKVIAEITGGGIMGVILGIIKSSLIMIDSITREISIMPP